MAAGDMAVLDAAVAEAHSTDAAEPATQSEVANEATGNDAAGFEQDNENVGDSHTEGETDAEAEGEQEAPLDLGEGEDDDLEKPPAKTPAELAAEKAATDKAAKPAVDEVSDADTSVKALQGFAAKSPEFKKVLDSDPALKASLYGAARRAARADQYDGLFQSPQLAQHLKIAGDEFIKMDDLYNSDDPAEFVKFLIANSLEYDERGEPVVENGRYKSTGAYEKVAQYWQGQWMDDVAKHAEKLSAMQHDVAQADGEELKEALKVINRVVFHNAEGNGPAKKAQDDDLAALPEHLRNEIIAARQRSAPVSNSKADADFTSNVDAGVQKMGKEYAEALVNNLLARNPKVVLGDFAKRHLIAEAIEKAESAARSNLAHFSTFKHLMKGSPRTQQGIDSLVNVKKAFYKEIVPGVIRELFKETTTSTLAAARARGEKINKQVARKEPPTTGRVNPSPSGPGGGDDFHNAIAAAAKTKGKALTQMEIMDLALGRS